MTTRSRSRSLALLPLLAAMVAALVVGLVSPASAAASCGIHWGSQARSGGTSSAPGLVTDMRAGRHACFDRLVIDLGAPATTGQHYTVRYRSPVLGDASGAPVPLAGGADIEILLAPANAHTATGRSTAPHRVSVAGFTTFREVRLITDFEAHVQIGLGVRARLPMRAFVLPGAPGSGDHARLVVDVAHRWSA